MKVLHLDFASLKDKGIGDNEYYQYIVSIVQRRFLDTNVLVTDDVSSLNSELIDLEIIRIEINKSTPFPSSDLIGENGGVVTPDKFSEHLGGAIPEKNYGFVNIKNIANETNADHPELLAESIATIASHEAFHLFGPDGHSSGINIMSDGSRILDILKKDGGKSLEFTDLQKSFLRKEIELFDNIKLSEYETIFDPQKVIFNNDGLNQNTDSVDTSTESSHEFLDSLF